MAAIGPATARALEERGVQVGLTPDEYVAEGILEGLGNVAGQRLLLARADIARRALADGLRLRGAEVDEIAAYRTVIQPAGPEMIQRALLGDEQVDAITFTSSSTARGLLQGLEAMGLDPRDALRGVALAAIGPITAATLREAGLEPALIAEEYTIPGLTDALAAYFTARAGADGRGTTEKRQRWRVRRKNELSTSMNGTALFTALAAICALLAAIFIFDQHLSRPRPHKLMWALGLLFYGLAAAAESFGAASHWTVAEYKVWYYFGGILTAAFLGLGTLFLLGPRRVAWVATAIAVVIAVYAGIRITFAPFPPPTSRR